MVGWNKEDLTTVPNKVKMLTCDLNGVTVTFYSTYHVTHIANSD